MHMHNIPRLDNLETDQIALAAKYPPVRYNGRIYPSFYGRTSSTLRLSYAINYFQRTLIQVSKNATSVNNGKVNISRGTST